MHGWLMMMKWKLFAAAGLLSLLSPIAAHATGNADCLIEEPGFNLTFEALYSYGGAGQFFQSRGRLELTDIEHPPGDWSFDFGASAVERQSMVADDISMLLRARHNGQDVTVTIATRRIGADEIDFEGSYELVIGPADKPLFSRTGKVACSAG